MNAEAIGAVRALFAEIDTAVPRDPRSQAVHARQLFEVLRRDGGNVVAIEEPTYQRTRIGELGTWTADPWDGPTYGIDASTTRPIEYNNGLVVDAAHAKTAVVSGNGTRSVEHTGRITGVVYFDDGESTLHSKRLESEHLAAELLRFPESAEEIRNVSKAVATVAQRRSEGRQAVDSLERIDGALFIDGSVLPLGLAYWVLLDHAGGRSPAGAWDMPAEIIGHYVDVVDYQYERGLPVIGIVKTSSMTQVIAALREKIERHDIRNPDGRLVDVPWVNDHQFMAEVLRFDDLEYLGYTSWFVSHGQEINSRTYDVLEPLADQLAHGTPSDYRRAFCYVRLPKTGDVFRIETPYLFVQEPEMRRKIQLKALKEIAKQRGVPRAINRADRLARISRDNRERFREMIESCEAAYDHNWDGRWRDLDDNPDL